MSTKSLVSSDEYPGYCYAYEAPGQECLDAQFDGVDFARFDRLQGVAQRVQYHLERCERSLLREHQLLSLQQRLFNAAGDEL